MVSGPNPTDMTNIIVLIIILGLLAMLIIPMCRNYIAARKTGLLLVTSLIDSTSALCVYTKNSFLPYSTLMPGDIGQNTKLNVFS